MCWKLTAIFSLATFGFGWSLSTLENQCVTDFSEDLDNDLLVGTWYHVMRFSGSGVTIPSRECTVITLQRPNSTELARYKAEYLSSSNPYSFDDDPIHENAGEFRPLGMVIGNKQAKFFIMDPNTHFFRPPFEIRIYQRINEDFIIYHDCNTRGSWRWLMSRNRNPSEEDVEAALSGRQDISNMRRQWLCVI